MFIIDNKGILRQITINDSHVSRSVPEARRLIEAIQHSEKSQPNTSKAGFIKGEKTQNYIYIYMNICVFIFSIGLSSSIEKSRPHTCLEKAILRELIE